MLLEYLLKNYKTNEPIFMSDIDLPISDTNLRGLFKSLCDSEDIYRFDNGIYYLKNKNRFNDEKEITSDLVAKYKYLSRNGKTFGYTSGYTFANKLGLSSSFPLAIEITTNNTSSKYREVEINNLKIILRKPKVEVNKDNVYILQLLDLLKDYDLYIDDDIVNAPEILKLFIRKNRISRNEIDKYLSYYPDKVYRCIYEMRLYEAFL